MAQHLAEQSIVPDLVLCSTSARTRETYERVEAALAQAPVHYERGIYAASADWLLERLRSVPDEVGSVLMIGHNPGFEDLALRLARPSTERDDLGVKFPTAALATLEFAGSWSDLQPGCATLVGFVRPPRSSGSP